MKEKLFHRLGTLMGLILFSAALWVFHQELKTYRFHDMVQYLKNLLAHQLLTALALTFLSYITIRYFFFNISPVVYATSG